MSRIPPVDPAEMPEINPAFDAIVERMGFVPMAQQIMARNPQLMRAFQEVAQATFNTPGGSVPLELKYLVGHLASKTTGCMYCSAHTGSNAARAGVDGAKVAAVWEYETSDLFSEAERVALSFAQLASQVPNMVTDDTFGELRRFYSDDEILEILSVVCLYGYLNRWNDTLATTLEAAPEAFATKVLADTGWSAGKHGDE